MYVSSDLAVLNDVINIHLAASEAQTYLLLEILNRIKRGEIAKWIIQYIYNNIICI